MLSSSLLYIQRQRKDNPERSLNRTMNKNEQLGIIDPREMRLKMLKRLENHGRLALNQAPIGIRAQYKCHVSRYYMMQNIWYAGKDLYKDFYNTCTDLIFPEAVSVIPEAATIAWLSTEPEHEAFTKGRFLQSVDMPLLSYGLFSKYPVPISVGVLSLHNGNTLPPEADHESFRKEAHADAVKRIAVSNGKSEAAVERELSSPLRIA